VWLLTLLRRVSVTKKAKAFPFPARSWIGLCATQSRLFQGDGHIDFKLKNSIQERHRMAEATNSLSDRARNTDSSRPHIEIHPLKIGDDPTPFRILNEEWISQYFTLEDKDRDVSGNPEEHILQRGGRVFMLYASGEPVGCVALIPAENRAFELSKMTITTRMRGLGLGRKLLTYAIEQARAIGANSLFLGSNAKLGNAIYLYRAMGFQYIGAEQIPRPVYARENVFMELPF
jgi:N-acetylglutamate synthase-like GNAT family acetyltransferase